MPRETVSENQSRESSVIAGRNAVAEALKKGRPIDCIYILKGADRGSMGKIIALAKQAGVRVIGTGRSDFPNQVNNVLGFPYIFRGALDVGATAINEEMKLAAAYAIANLVSAEELNAEYVIPSPFDPRVAPAVASGVAKAAIDTGVAQKTDVTPEQVAEHTRQLVNNK